jgi:2-polyprenyl-3-methyl-5-hydroxy-6-metoxy-1,4-benzoquinol methylase
MKRDGSAGTRPDDATYFDNYWRARFNPGSFARRIRTLHRNYSRHLPQARDARIVEIGPGFGEMLRYLADRGYTRTTALDNDAALVTALNRQGLAGVICVADVAAYLRERAVQYDCVIALHVLEHFEAAAGRELLLAMYSALTPGGRVIIEVPNMANFITGSYARWADYTHRHGYTQESLSAALQSAGFEVRACFGVRRAIASALEAMAATAQGITTAIAWTLLKVNYPQARIIAAPAIGIVGVRPVATTAESSEAGRP